MFLVHGRNVTGGRGQPHRHIRTKAVAAAIPAIVFHRQHRQVPPLRELCGDQPRDELRVDPGAAVNVSLLIHPCSMQSSPIRGNPISYDLPSTARPVTGHRSLSGRRTVDKIRPDLPNLGRLLK